MRFSITFLWLLAGSMSPALALALAQAPGLDRMVIATNVACRDRPDASSPVVGALGIGDQLDTSQAREVGGEIWYRVNYRETMPRELRPYTRLGDCWVFGPLTTAFDPADPDPALIALADRALGRAEASFEELVAAENTLTAGPVAAAFTASPILQARRLQLVDRAVSRMRDPREPLTRAWLQSHGDMLAYWSIGLAWYVRPEVYWRVYEAFAGSPGAEEAAWAAANASVFFDECFTACRLDWIAQTRMRYWIPFPAGRHVEAALSFAAPQVELAGRFCILAATGNLAIDLARVEALVDTLRASLDAVSANGRAALLAGLDDIEQHCIDSRVADLDDPQAIPGLARALGSGFTMVPRRLAGFGEAALPAILDVMRAPALDRSVARDGLVALRYMLELPDMLELPEASQLPAAALAVSTESRVTIHMAASLDGFMARRDGSVDWLETADEFAGGETMDPEFVAEFLKTIDCYVMGSRTYETALEFEAKGQGWAYGDKPTFVLTTRELRKVRDSIEFCSGDLAKLVNERLRSSFSSIWFVGGGHLSGECLRRGLADKIRYSILPVLIGEGISFFEGLDVDVALHLLGRGCRGSLREFSERESECADPHDGHLELFRL